MMALRMAVTFEFLTRQPETWRGTVAATSPETCARLAIREARRHLAPREWTSYVCVALERVHVDRPSRTRRAEMHQALNDLMAE